MKIPLTREQIENAFLRPLSQEMRLKYQGALLALNKAEEKAAK